MNPIAETFPPGEWMLIKNEPARGAWNMAVDEAILEAVIAGRSGPVLRLYAWEPACVSLGFAQSVSDIDRFALEARGWEVVRRPTGGRAILHTDELTYAVIGSASDPRLTGSVLESYQRLSLALLAALQMLGLPAESQESTSARRAEPNPVCFEIPSNYEITVEGKKIIGSAQARRKGGVLQHGSLPLYGDLSRLIQVLDFKNGNSREAAAQRLNIRATTVEGFLGRRVSWEEAADKFKHAFQQMLNLSLIPTDLSPLEIGRANELVLEKYANQAWTEKV